MNDLSKADWFQEYLMEERTNPVSPDANHANHAKRRSNTVRDATRYDKSPTAFLYAIILAATVIIWLLVLSLVR